MQKSSSLKQIVLLTCVFLCIVSVVAGVSALSDGSKGDAITLKQDVAVHKVPAEIGSASGSESYVFVTKWGSLGSCPWEFNNPTGIAVDSSGNVYVVDGNWDHIKKFNSTGTYLTMWGSEGSGDGQFHFPQGITVDSTGNVYVTDSGDSLSGNSRIQKFSSTGLFLAKWGSSGSGDGQFSYPIGIAVDSSGNVYVADKGNLLIQKFDSTGTFLTKWGSYGSDNGQFQNPFGVAVDSSGNVYVADTGDQGDPLHEGTRIQKFDPTGTFLTKWGSYGSDNGQFQNPFGVAVDSSGNVYVADLGNYRIQKFSSTGSFITKWGSFGTGDGQFYQPSDVAVDSSGNVYVADSGNHRIQKFAPSWASAGTVARSLPATAAPGATITVTLTPGAPFPTAPNWNVTETLPAGWTFVSTTANDHLVMAGMGFVAVRFTQLSAAPITYTVTAPAAEAAYTFSGTFADGNANTGTVSGATSVTVGSVVSPVQRYDTNGTPGIQKDEMITALNDFLIYHTLPKADLVTVLNAFLFP